MLYPLKSPALLVVRFRGSLPIYLKMYQWIVLWHILELVWSKIKSHQIESEDWLIAEFKALLVGWLSADVSAFTNVPVASTLVGRF